MKLKIDRKFITRDLISLERQTKLVSIALHSKQYMASGFTKLIPIYINFMNGVIVLSKSVTKYLGGYYGQCSDYGQTSDNTFGAISSDHCLRKCFKQQCYRHLNCIPFYLANFSSEYDLWHKEWNLCNESQTLECDSLFESKPAMDYCHNKCPKDCLNVEYKHRLVSKEWSDWSDSMQVLVYSDRSLPETILEERPKCTMVDLLVKLGGLLCLFHGLYIYIVMIWIKDIIAKYYYHYFLRN